jgi:hypothetical protein
VQGRLLIQSFQATCTITASTVAGKTVYSDSECGVVTLCCLGDLAVESKAVICSAAGRLSADLAFIAASRRLIPAMSVLQIPLLLIDVVFHCFF